MIVIGNQKNYMLINDVVDFLKNTLELKNAIICPSNIYLPYYLNKNFDLGIQNIELDKVITGEISAKQAKNMGIKYAILGHSERRINYGENNLHVKIVDALNNKLKVILCIGETLEEKNLHLTEEILKKQISDLDGVNSLENLIIAYEPCWAIGTGVIPTNDEIYGTIDYIKKLIKNLYNYEVKVLYGGSVNKDNISSLVKIANLDGVLVGKASTNVGEFKKILEVVNS